MKFLKYLQIPIVVVGIFFLFLIISEVRSCVNEQRGISDAEWKGRIESHKEEIEKKEEELQEFTREKEEENLELQNEILDLQKGQQADRKKMSQKDKSLKKLEDEFSLIEDVNLKLANSQSQVKVWEKKFSILEDDFAKEEQQKLDWKKAYENELEINKKVREQSYKKDKLLRDYEEKISGLEKKNKSINRWRKVERFIGYTGWGLFAVFALKGE